MSKKSYNWNAIQDYLAENTQAGLLMAILEADKILMSVVRDLGYPGEDDKTRLYLARRLFSDFKRLKQARRISQKIRQELDFSLNPKLTEEILAVYYQALLDIKEHRKPYFNHWQKILFFLNKKIRRMKKILKWTGLYLFLFLLGVFFLDHTALGNKLVKYILKITDFIFSWFLILILLGLGIIVTIFGSIWYFKGRKKMDIDISANN